MNSKKDFRLNNGINMPSIGLGVLFAQNNGEVENAIRSAIENRYGIGIWE